jgi:signal transduction histidine kinase
MSGGEIAALVTAVSTGLAGLVVAVGGLLKNLSEIRLLKHQVDELEGKVKELTRELEAHRKRNRKLWGYIEQLLVVIKSLMQQLRDAELTPCAEPPDWIDDGQE